MNAKTLIPLIVAIALGVVAAKMGKDMMGKGHDAAPGMKLSKQVVAKVDIAPGSTIAPTDVVVKDMPADGLSDQAFREVGEVVGRVVTTQIVRNQAIMNTLLAPNGSSGGLTAMIPPGMRAVTIEVNEVSGLAGLLLPGSKVDLVQTIQVKGTDADMMAKTIVANLTVLATGRRTSTISAPGQEGDPMARSVTLLASAAEAEAIDLASHVGSPRLVLRNSADKDATPGKGITVAELRGGTDAAGGPAGDPFGALVAQMLKNGPATRPSTATPTEIAKADLPKIKPAAFREVEVIRAGASTSVRVNLRPDTSLTGDRSADKKLFGDD